jgi:trk system potassium uptake protein
MKIVIAGAGKVGKTLTKELTADGYDITLIDRRADVLEIVGTKYDVITYQGNAATVETLEEADIQSADVFIAATSADEVNVLACMTARALNPDVHVIARVRTPEYVSGLLKLTSHFGLSLVINPEREAAIEIASLLKLPEFMKVEHFAKSRAEIAELKITDNSRIKNLRLSDFHKKVQAQVLISAILRDGEIILPNGDTVLQTNDRLYVTGTNQELHTLLNNIGVIKKPVKHVVIAGGSRIAYYLAQYLEEADIKSTIIEIDEKACVKLAGLLPNSTIIHADASDHSVLESEDVSDYDAFVGLTGMDEVNMVCALYANKSNISTVVTKLGRGRIDELTDKLDIGSIVSPKDIVSMHIIRYVRAIRNKEGAALTIHRIANGRVDASEFVVDETTKHVGVPLKQLNIKKDILINSIARGDIFEIPNGDSTLEKGDIIVILTDDSTTVHQINDIFED